MTKDRIRLIHNTETDVYENLAIDHSILDLSREVELPTIRIWQNKPSVVVGRTQILKEEVNEKYCLEHDIQISRRISGGGCVYHDLGNLNISYYLPWRLIPSKRNIIASTKFFTKFLKTILKKMNYENLHVQDTSSLIFNDLKISGSAGHTRSGWVLHHCTLLFNANLDHLENSLLVKDPDPADKRKSRYFPTTNLPNFSISKFKSTLVDTIKDNIEKEVYEDKMLKREVNFKSKLKNQLYLLDSWIYQGKRKLVRE